MNPLLAAGKPGHPVRCQKCGHEFPQDPPFEVECPDCHAPPGQTCRRPSGHSGSFVPFHAARDLLALERGHYDHECGPRWDRNQTQEAQAGQLRLL